MPERAAGMVHWADDGEASREEAEEVDMARKKIGYDYQVDWENRHSCIALNLGYTYATEQ